MMHGNKHSLRELPCPYEYTITSPTQDGESYVARTSCWEMLLAEDPDSPASAYFKLVNAVAALIESLNDQGKPVT